MSLKPLVDAVAAAQPMLAALCSRHTDFTVFSHHMLRLLLPVLDPGAGGEARGIWVPSSPAGEALVGVHTWLTVRRSFSCCQRTLPTSQTAVEFQVKDLPLDALLIEACAHQEELVEGEPLLCDVCAATASRTAGRLCSRRSLPDTPVLRIGFDRVAPHTWKHVADPIGAFPEVLRLPAHLFEHGRAHDFRLVALLLLNHSPLRAALGYSVVVRGANGIWWWHRYTAGEWEVSRIGRPIAQEQNWEGLQELRDIIVGLYYVRL